MSTEPKKRREEESIYGWDVPFVNDDGTPRAEVKRRKQGCWLEVIEYSNGSIDVVAVPGDAELDLSVRRDSTRRLLR